MSVQHAIQQTTDGGFEITLKVTVKSQAEWNDEMRAGIIDLDQVRENWLIENRLASAANGHPTLTPRENQVFVLLLDGKQNKEIAHALTISTNTVEAHVQHIHRKLGTRSRVELMRQYGKAA